MRKLQLLPHFIDGASEAQRVPETERTELRFRLQRPGFRVQTLTTRLCPIQTRQPDVHPRDAGAPEDETFSATPPTQVELLPLAYLISQSLAINDS